MVKLIHEPEPVSKNHYLLKFLMPGVKSSPGQFINIVVDKNGPLLRRPFSIFNQNNEIIEIVIRVIGKGTKILSEKKKKNFDILGPLGKGFSIERGKKILIVGGGVGNAPLYYLAKKLKKFNNNITFIYGHRSGEFIYLEKQFKGISDNFLAVTDDGTVGKKGFTTDIAEEIIKTQDFEKVYTCGPMPMMSKLVNLIDKKIPVEVSIENYFGCGIGVCSGCAVETESGLKRVCVDGPVFNGNILNWDDL